MKILVTGGAGYIGSHTVVELLTEGHEVVVLDNLDNANNIVLDRIQKITGKSAIFYNFSITEKPKMRDLFEKEKIDAVIHFAALKAVGESLEKPLQYYSVNIGGTINLLEVMREFNVKNFIFSSSATVYGPTYPVPFTEDMKPSSDTTTPYGYSKVVLERILEDIGNADKDFKIISLRYFNPVGAHQSGLIGESPIGEPKNLPAILTQIAIGKIEKFTVFGNDYDTPDGTCTRDYIHVVDLAKGHTKALNKISEISGYEVYNLGTGKDYSVLEMIEAFEKATGEKIPYEIGERRPNNADIPICYSSAEKAEKELLFKAEFSIEDMWRDSWRFQQKNPNGYQ
ncbi:MAG: UDP-glucose 4-epimerase GalE [Defluviitaleaceae bacterium]|nr:UDP-glucose 4-epimerase GalE [Defluviitaleaceae bacterium]